jgi:hypothetical protein
MLLMACPQCHQTDQLFSVEQLEGLCAMEVPSDPTEPVAHFESYTEVAWDSSTTIGFYCRGCDFSYHGADWRTMLVPDPKYVPTEMPDEPV